MSAPRIVWVVFALLLLGAAPVSAAEPAPLPQDPGSPAQAPAAAAAEAPPKEAAPEAPANDGEAADALASAEEPAEADEGPVNFKGTLKQRGSRKLLGGVSVFVKGTAFEAISDAQGQFEFHGLPPGKYKIVVPTTGYETYETNEEIKPNELTTVTYYLQPILYSTLEIVVRGQKEKKEVSKKIMKIDEVKNIPGTLNDAVRAVENMPGVARGGTSAMGVVIRGSNATDSIVTLDGHDLPMLFHFGGMKSIYNSDLLDEINLYTGGFGVQYGMATGGVVDLKSREPRKDRWGGYIDTSFVDATALAEGPITKNGDVTTAFALRRSTIDLILPAVMKGQKDLNFTTYPVYYDYQAKLNWKLDKENTFSLDVYGLYDDFKMLSSKVADDEPEFAGGLGYRVSGHSLVPRFRYKGANFENDFSPAYINLDTRFRIGTKYYLDATVNQAEVIDNMRFKLTPNHTLGIGVYFRPSYYTLDANVIRPPKEGDVNVSLSNAEKLHVSTSIFETRGSLWINDEMVYGPLTVIPGVRLNYESYLQIFSASPALLTRWKVIAPLTLKASAGLYNKPPNPDEVLEPFGNRGLGFERAVHVVAGLEWDITNVLSLDVQGYYKYLYNLVNALSKTGQATNGKSYANNAKGRVYGGEVLLRYAYTDRFFGWLSYSISRSERTDGPGTKYRLFDLDQTHNLTVVASWQFAKGWRLGGRFRLTSGEPYTDILSGIFNGDTGTYLPLYNSANKNSKRGELFHQLDLRIDKQWIFNVWTLSLYLDVQNVYFHANAIGKSYNYDFSEMGTYRYLPILPSIGLRADF